MTLADIVGVMSGPDRVRITKGRVELFAGYLGNLVHMTSKGTQAAYLMRTREKQKARRQQY